MNYVFYIPLSSGQMADVLGLLLVMLIVSRKGLLVNISSSLLVIAQCCVQDVHVLSGSLITAGYSFGPSWYIPV